MLDKQKEWAFKRDQYIKKIIENERKQRWLSQEKLWELIWYKQSAIQPYITWSRLPKDDEIYLLIFREAFLFSEEKIEKILKEAKLQEIKAEFWEDIWVKNFTIQDNWQEPITTVEEAEKILFKLSWVKYSDKAKRKLRLAMDMIREDEKED